MNGMGAVEAGRVGGGDAQVGKALDEHALDRRAGFHQHAIEVEENGGAGEGAHEQFTSWTETGDYRL